ncbi:MAG: hypothetical protein HRT65_16055 [Flavobacteriaceae bacterium]|nr:hypothetical protein [Flavobacteriaceae bacterium]
MSSKTRTLLAFMATVVGGFSFILFTTITRDILFDGLNFCSASTMKLMLGGTTMFTAAVTAGFMTSLIVVRQNYLPHMVISAYVLLNISYVASCGAWNLPMAFEIALNLMLILGIWFGDYVAKKFPLAPV